jgi:hypothetical protein
MLWTAMESLHVRHTEPIGKTPRARPSGPRRQEARRANAATFTTSDLSFFYLCPALCGPPSPCGAAVARGAAALTTPLLRRPPWPAIAFSSDWASSESNSVQCAAALFSCAPVWRFLPKNSVFWVTAQGRSADPREHPLRIQPGVGRLASRLSEGMILPLVSAWKGRCYPVSTAQPNRDS